MLGFGSKQCRHLWRVDLFLKHRKGDAGTFLGRSQQDQTQQRTTAVRMSLRRQPEKAKALAAVYKSAFPRRHPRRCRRRRLVLVVVVAAAATTACRNRRRRRRRRRHSTRSPRRRRVRPRPVDVVALLVLRNSRTGSGQLQ